MELLIIRHSIAAPAGPGVRDQDRPLTAEGVALFTKAVGGLERLGLRVDTLLHSPLKRAVETAGILSRICDGEQRETPLLARPPGGELLEAIMGAGVGGGRVALVGHQPYVSELTAILLSGDPTLSMGLAFDTGTVSWLSGHPRPGQMGLKGLLSAQALAAASE